MVNKKRILKEKPYGGGKYTKAAFFSFIRSALRQKSRRWAPIYQCLQDARRPSRSRNKRLKWEFICAKCKRWYPASKVSVDHKVPAGSLKDFADLPGFVERLFCEKDQLQVLCLKCHDIKTKKERKGG
mgnify:FL=1